MITIPQQKDYRLYGLLISLAFSTVMPDAAHGQPEESCQFTMIFNGKTFTQKNQTEILKEYACPGETAQLHVACDMNQIYDEMTTETEYYPRLLLHTVFVPGSDTFTEANCADFHYPESHLCVQNTITLVFKNSCRSGEISHGMVVAFFVYILVTPVIPKIVGIRLYCPNFYPPTSHLKPILSIDRHFNKLCHTITLPQAQQALPYLYYELLPAHYSIRSQNRTFTLPGDVVISVQYQHADGTTSSLQQTLNRTLFNDGWEGFKVGPLDRGSSTSIQVMSTAPNFNKTNCVVDLDTVNRTEQLMEPEYHYTSEPYIHLSWRNLSFPEVLGALTATTPGNLVLAHCPPSSNDVDRIDCNISLAGTSPLPWIWVQAGNLPDAETRNLTNLEIFWQINNLAQAENLTNWQIPIALTVTALIITTVAVCYCL